LAEHITFAVWNSVFHQIANPHNISVFVVKNLFLQLAPLASIEQFRTIMNIMDKIQVYKLLLFRQSKNDRSAVFLKQSTALISLVFCACQNRRTYCTLHNQNCRLFFFVWF
jgi:hypothetical protein